MAIYNASLLISASNATYFTNVTGGIAAVAVRDFNDTWISSSALLTGSNTFVGNQIISGNVDINGAFSASLQTGYLFVGDGNGRTQAVATSSIITNIATGSFATTGSNTFIGNQIISGNVLPLVDGQGDLGTDTFKWNSVTVNGTLKGSSLNTTGRGVVGTLRVGDETFPLSFLSDREIVGDGTGANTHLYYGTSSVDVTALREFVYAQSGSDADFTSVSASFNTRIENATGSAATTIFEVVYTGENITKGDPLYISGSQGANPIVYKADAADANKMPVTFISNETIGASNTTDAIILGLIEGINLTGYTAGQAIYVAEGGGWSTSLPSGSNSITQLLGVVTKAGSGGKGLVLNPGPALLPGLDSGKLWVGNSNNQPTEITTSSFVSSTLTGSFATTGSNVFTGFQQLYTEGGQIPLQISSSAYYGINLYNQGIQIQGPGGPRIQFPNATWLNGNENDNFQFTGDTDNPLTRGIDFFLYGTGSRSMRFRNNSGPGGNMEFSTSQSAMTFNAGNNIDITAGNNVSITGSQTYIQGLRYPATDGTNGQALITNGSGILSFGNVSINTGSFATTGSNTFNGNQNIVGDIALLSGSNLGKITFPNNSQLSGIYGDQFKFAASETSAQFLINSSSSPLNMIFENRGNGGQTQFLTEYGSEYHSASSYQFNGGDVTINGNIYANNLTGSGGVSGSYATLGANTFTGSQTIQSGSQIIFNGLNGSSNDNGLVWGTSTPYPAKLFYQSGSQNFLQFQGDVGIDFSVGSPALANSNINFRTQNTGGQIQFQSDLSSISLRAGTNTTISSSTTNIYSPSSGGGGINNRGVVSIGQNIGTGLGESYLLGYSGSLVLGNSVNNPTYAALAHITSSQPNGNNGLIFKPNSNTGRTILNGSANIFTNPNTPTTNYIRYVGGSNNIYLNNTNGINSQITASAISVSGNRPTMNNNIFQGTADFAINQAVNGGTHTYNNNLFGAANAMNINALAWTGSNFTISDNIFKGGLVTINPASASLAEIAAGVSGSANVEVLRNISLGTGGITFNVGPQAKTNFNSILGNVLQAGLTITNISSSFQVNASNNNTNQAQTYTNAGAAGLGIHRQAGSMNNNYGGMTLIASASAIQATTNISTNALTVTNRMYSGSVIGSGSLIYSSNINAGGQNTYTITGSFGGTGFLGMSNNAVIGNSNTIFTNVEGRGNYVGFLSNVIGGSNLILTGSNNNAITASGGAYFGRFNANDGIRNQSAENIFFVGTGTSASDRKTGFLIDSGSNTFVEGTFNVSGSTSMNGNQDITGSLLVSSFTTLASVSSSLDFADDTAAAAGGVPLGGLYRNGNFVMIRLT